MDTLISWDLPSLLSFPRRSCTPSEVSSSELRRLKEGRFREELDQQLYTNTRIFKENLKLITESLIESIWREKLRSDRLDDSLRLATKESLLGPCEEIRETEEEHLAGSDIYSLENSERHEARPSSTKLADPPAEPETLELSKPNDLFFKRTSDNSHEKSQSGSFEPPPRLLPNASRSPPLSRLKVLTKHPFGLQSKPSSPQGSPNACRSASNLLTRLPSSSENPPLKAWPGRPAQASEKSPQKALQLSQNSSLNSRSRTEIFSLPGEEDKLRLQKRTNIESRLKTPLTGKYF